MAGRIAMSPEQMQQRITEVRNAQADFQAVFKKTEGIVSALETEWEGEASRGFAEQFARLKQTAFQPMDKMYEDLGHQLTETQRVIQDLDQQIAGKFRQS